MVLGPQYLQGLQFKGTWDASGGGGGSPDLTQAGNKGDGFLWI